MARLKGAIAQKDFSLGSVRTDARERDDTELVASSLRHAKNVVVLSPGGMEARPGFRYVAQVTGVEDFFEINPTDDLAYDLLPVPNGIEIYSEDGTLVASFATATWSSVAGLWVLPIRENILIGSQNDPIHILQYDAGTWTFGLFAFAELAGGASAQPYWRFDSDAKIRATSTSPGATTVYSDADLFTADYVGLRIRYVDREIEITGYTDARTVTGTIIQELPPTQDLTVGDASGFLVGEAVEADPSGSQGVITGVSGSTVTVLITKYFEGFKTSDEIISPSHKSSISAVATASPAYTDLWDEPMISAVRGYPGSAAHHSGRVIFVDFPEVADGFAASVAGTINNFEAGTNDDDAIIESVGASLSARVRHAASAEDLILLTTKGPYYVGQPDGAAITPTNFNPRRFDTIGASSVRPVVVNDGVVFVTSKGESIAACILQGGVYKAWKVQVLSEYHNHLLDAPTKLGSTSDDSATPERYVFAVNSDGTVAVMRWDRSGDQETVGWVPWDTSGTFKSMTSIFGVVHALVERDVAGTPKLFLERAEAGTYLDCATGFTAAESLELAEDGSGYTIVTDTGDTIIAGAGDALHLSGDTVHVWIDRYNLGEYLIDSLGFPTGLSLTGTDRQIGYDFSVEMTPWRRYSEESYAGDINTKGPYEIGVVVQDTVQYQIGEFVRSAYDKGGVTSSPPPLKTEIHYEPIIGRGYDDTLTISKPSPGPFRVLAIYHKVTV